MSHASNQNDTLNQLKRALGTLKDMRAKLEAVEQARREPIAIIGLGCRFPGGADSPQAFWHLLKNGIDAISEIPSSRWDVNALYDPDFMTPGKMNTRWGGFLDQVDRFDPGFFGISPREASHMDPQQRLLLEVAYEALEDAGQPLERLAGSQTGVFVGIHSHSNDYAWFQLNDLTGIDTHTGTGTAHSIVANRLSYVFDLRGPSLIVDTACSSSLIAVHLACQSLRNEECHLALAGGVNLMLSPEASVTFSKLQMMATDGRCKTFDARADGFVRGEGCGLIVLKRLSDALADGDSILALIQGSAINQDGHTNGLTAPNGLSQEAVICQALANARIDPGQITYVETHGTGTALGDPIEVEALANVIGQPDAANGACYLGSVKTNIGHLEAAAGIAGLIKAVLALQHEMIPPHLHFQALNPHISLSKTRFAIPTTDQSWPVDDQARYAAVSSFGFGGTNGQVILKEAPPQAEVQAPDEETSVGRPYLLPLSARSPEALQDLARTYQTFLADTELSLSDICYSASLRRSHLDHRLALVGESPAALIDLLGAFLQGESHPDLASEQELPASQQGLVFVFSGQGPQWPGMGQELLQSEPIFRAALVECDELLREQGATWSLLEELRANPAQSRLDDTEIAQPAIFALQVALVALCRSWGIEPEAVVGHSVGEVAAAYVAGVFTMPEAVRIIFHRGRLMQPATGLGKMAVIGLSQAETEALLVDHSSSQLSVAAVNSPTATVLSGDVAGLREVLQTVEARGVFNRMLPGNYAFHSPQMEPFQHELVQALAGLNPRPAAIPIYSTVTGTRSQPGEMDAAYWGHNMREPVRFAEAIAALEADGHSACLEISPHPVLAVSISQCLSSSNRTILPSLRRHENDRAMMLRSLGALYSLGYPVNWNKLYPTESRFVRLPTYPWQRKRYWLETVPSRRGRTATHTRHNRSDTSPHPLLSQRPSSPIPTFEAQLDAASVPVWARHRLYGLTVLPTTAYLDMALAAASAVFDADETSVYVLEAMNMQSLLVLPEARSRTAQLILTPEQSETATFRLYSLEDETEDEWRLHAAGTVRRQPIETPPTALAVTEILARCREHPLADYYDQLGQYGLEFRAELPLFAQLWQGDNEALAQLQPSEQTPDARFTTHPALIDAGIQLLLALALADGKRDPARADYIWRSLGRGVIYATTHRPHWVQAVVRQNEAAYITGDLRLLDQSGQPIVEILGLRFEPLDKTQLQVADISDWLYDVVWQPQARKPRFSRPSQAGHWLIFSDQNGLGAELAERLSQRGETCALVFPDSTPKNSVNGSYQVNPACPEDFQNLLNQVQANGRPLRGVVHLWSVDASEPPETTTALEVAQTVNCQSALYLVQAISKAVQKQDDPAQNGALPHLWIVTRGTQAIGSLQAEMIAVSPAPLWGLGRVIALEHPELWGGLIDLDHQTPAEAGLMLSAEMWESDGEDQVAYRQERRYVARLRRTSGGPVKNGFVGINPDRTYLITGGLGELGLQVAHWLVTQGAQHLILTSRTGLPDRTGWDQIASDSSTGKRIAAVRALEALGSTVTIAKADVSDMTQMATLFEALRHSQSPLRGIIHAAGTVTPRPVVEMEAGMLQDILRPKVTGAWILHQLTQEMDLDFFVLFSSGAAIWGSAGMAHYAAANHFLDALAHYRRGLGLPALSINWGWWADGGMATAETEQYFTQIGVEAMPAPQALAALERLLAAEVAQKTVAAIDWQIFKPIYEAKRRRPLLEEFEAQTKQVVADSTQNFVQRLAEAAPAERWDLLLAHIRGEVARVLGFDPSQPLDLQRGFFKLGMDSIMTVQLRNRLELGLGCSLPPTVAFEYPTIQSLTGYLVAEVLSLDIADQNTPPAEIQPQDDASTANLDDLSDEDLWALFDDELAAVHELVEGN